LGWLQQPASLQLALDGGRHFPAIAIGSVFHVQLRRSSSVALRPSLWIACHSRLIATASSLLVHARGRVEVLPCRGDQLGIAWMVHRLDGPNPLCEGRVLVVQISGQFCSGFAGAADQYGLCRLQRLGHLAEELRAQSFFPKPDMIGLPVDAVLGLPVLDCALVDIIRRDAKTLASL
jgi:hypothetical protein